MVSLSQGSHFTCKVEYFSKIQNRSFLLLNQPVEWNIVSDSISKHHNTIKCLVLHAKNTEKDGGTLFPGENQNSKIPC
jgi:hypothetical protein